MPKRRKKKIKKIEEVTASTNESKSKLIKEILESPVVLTIASIIGGWIYVGIWMNTQFYDHSYDFFDQPNLEWAFVPPWIITFVVLLNYKVETRDLIGGTILYHVLALLAFSLFAVLSMFGLMLIGMLVVGLIAVILGF